MQTSVNARRFSRPQSDQKSPLFLPPILQPTSVCTIRRADGFTTEIRRVGFGGFEGERETPMWHYGEIVPVACINVVTWLRRAIDAGRSIFYGDF